MVITIQIDASDFRNPLAEGENSPISSLAHISDHRTFDKFSTRKAEKLPSEVQESLEKALYLSQQFADKPDGWLVLMGTFGTGKTHLAAAIGHYRAGLGDDPIFSVVPDLLDHLRATFSPSSTVSYDNIFNQVKTTKLLVLDDLGTQSATPWAREKLYQILNYRYETRLPTVITTSASLEEIDPRIRSRIMDERVCLVHKIIATPYQTRALKRKQIFKIVNSSDREVRPSFFQLPRPFQAGSIIYTHFPSLPGSLGWFFSSSFSGHSNTSSSWTCSNI